MRTSKLVDSHKKQTSQSIWWANKLQAPLAGRMNIVAGKNHRAPDWNDAGNCRALQRHKGRRRRRANR